MIQCHTRVRRLVVRRWKHVLAINRMDLVPAREDDSVVTGVAEKSTPAFMRGKSLVASVSGHATEVSCLAF